MNAAIAAVTREQPACTDRGAGRGGHPVRPNQHHGPEHFADPQVQHLGLARPVEHPRPGFRRFMGTPINLTGLEDRIRRPTQMQAGVPTRSWPDWAMNRDAIAKLRTDGASSEPAGAEPAPASAQDRKIRAWMAAGASRFRAREGHRRAPRRRRWLTLTSPSGATPSRRRCAAGMRPRARRSPPTPGIRVVVMRGASR